MNFFGHVNLGSQPCSLVSFTSLMTTVFLVDYNIAMIWNRVGDFCQGGDILVYHVNPMSFHHSSDDVLLISGEALLHINTAEEAEI